MTVRSRFTLDTNILVYAVDREAGTRHDGAKDIVARAAFRNCLLSVQSLAEFFHATTRKRLLEPQGARAFVRDWLAVFDTYQADPTSLADAMELSAEHRMSFWDAMLWAAARQAGCAVLLSEDMQHGFQLRGVRVVDPFRPDAASELQSLLER